MKLLQTIRNKIAYVTAALLAVMLYQSAKDDADGIIQDSGFDWNSLVEIPRVYANVEDDSPPEPSGGGGSSQDQGSGLSCSGCSNGAVHCDDEDGNHIRIGEAGLPDGMSSEEAAAGLESGDLVIVTN